MSRTPTRAQLSGTLEIRPGPLRQFAVIGVAAGAFFGWVLVLSILRFRQHRAIVLTPTRWSASG